MMSNKNFIEFPTEKVYKNYSEVISPFNETNNKFDFSVVFQLFSDSIARKFICL